MPTFALLISDVLTERRNYTAQPADIPHKNVRWLPVEVEGNDAYDSATQVKTGPVTTVEATRVLDTYTIRSKTVEELDADKVARIEDMNGQQALIKALLNLHNRIRTLEGLPTHTMAQFKNALKALL